ncbi:MAG TPA: cell division protein ZipA C-terminal FtsZ-binding domain-containing protein [Candidatus Competibacteraceae bacterium]|nr:cell division protein ZipA C-terminal FtsZ-binding domain-containing protein [Candidatus Competibacteraceae bacterium]
MEMLDKTQLQWLLTGIGAVVVALIYLWGMRSRIKEGIRKRRRRPTEGNEPVLGSATEPMSEDLLVDAHDFGELGRITPDHHLAGKVLVDVEIRPILRQESPPIAEANAQPSPMVVELTRELRREPAIPAPPKMTVALTVIAPRGQSFKGAAIQVAAHELGFQLSALGLFDYGPEDDSDPIFSMAHLRKPGSFDLKMLDDLATPGLLLFMNLPGPLEEMQALERLVVAVDQLAQKLGGMICDERRNRLTNQGLMHLRSEVAEFQRQRRIWAQSSG